MSKIYQETIHQKEVDIIKHSISLAIKKMQIKFTIRYHNTPTRTAKISQVKTQNAGQDVEKLDLSFISDGNIKW